VPTKLFTAPTEEPLSLAEAKAQCRVDDELDDAELLRFIKAARLHVEKRLGQQLCTATLRLYLDRFKSRVIELAMPPLIAVSSVKYYDLAGELITMSPAAYDVDNVDKPGRIAPSYGNFWPVTLPGLNKVVIEYTAGYGAAADVPENIKHALRLIVGEWYIHRELSTAGALSGTTAKAVEDLLAGEWHGSYALEGHQ
jgi:uncharacterized phiE125 gp8 family phage protein